MNYSKRLRETHHILVYRVYLKHRNSTLRFLKSLKNFRRTVGRSDERTVGPLDGRSDGQTVGRTDGCTDGRSDGRTDDARMKACMHAGNK